MLRTLKGPDVCKVAVHLSWAGYIAYLEEGVSFVNWDAGLLVFDAGSQESFILADLEAQGRRHVLMCRNDATYRGTRCLVASSLGSILVFCRGKLDFVFQRVLPALRYRGTKGGRGAE